MIDTLIGIGIAILIMGAWLLGAMPIVIIIHYWRKWLGKGDIVE